MNRINITLQVFASLFFLLPTLSYAQMPGEFSNRYIRVAEVGQLADTVNVWGDVSSSGRYIIPKETTLPELISFGFGYTQLRGGDANIDWTKTQIEVKYLDIKRQKD